MRDRNGSLWRREMAAVARQSVLMAKGATRRRRLANAPRVAVFVHGFMATGPVFDPMRAHVAGRTGLETVDFTYSPWATFEAVTTRFERFVTKWVDPDSTISLVGHSLGGLVARWFLQEQGGHARVDRVVTVATPHGGTEAVRRIPGPLAATLVPESPVIGQLARGRERVRHVPHTAVVAGDDHLVRPTTSAASLDGARVHWLEGVGHNEVLFDRRAHELVQDALG